MYSEENWIPMGLVEVLSSFLSVVWPERGGFINFGDFVLYIPTLLCFSHSVWVR